MKCDLTKELRSIGERIPTQIGKDSIVFDSIFLPKISRRLETSNLVIRKAFHDYNSYSRIDSLCFFMNKEMCTYIGLLILSVLFHDSKKVAIKPLGAQSDIKNLVIDYDYETSPKGTFNFITRPHKFEYFPEAVEKHPWVKLGLPSTDFPLFLLTNEEECLVKDEEWNKRDTVLITGIDEAMVRLAELFLNIGNPNQAGTEFILESELGFRGVGPGSAEVNLILPGDIQWDDSLFK